MLGGISATSARNVDQSSPRELSQITGHVLRAKVEASLGKRIRQPGIGVAGNRHVRLFREFLEKRIHEIGTERAVQAHRERLYMPYSVPECLRGLRRDHRLASAPHCRR